jgi:hypothetical protein
MSLRAKRGNPVVRGYCHGIASAAVRLRNDVTFQVEWLRSTVQWLRFRVLCIQYDSLVKFYRTQTS